MIIEVCGPGCPRCEATEKNVIKALQEMGLALNDEAAVVKVKDINEISARGVILTPAVIIDGVKVSEGKIPSTGEVKKWVEERK